MTKCNNCEMDSNYIEEFFNYNHTKSQPCDNHPGIKSNNTNDSGVTMKKKKSITMIFYYDDNDFKVGKIANENNTNNK